MRRRVGTTIATAFVLLAVACSPPPPTETATGAGTLQILFIGSSHLAWHDAPGACRNLIEATGRRVHVGRVLKPGRLLDELAVDEDVLDAIAARPWDFVVLQGACATVAYPETHHLLLPALGRHELEPALAALAHAARQRGAVVIYVQPWAFADGLAWLPDHDEDYQAMQDAIDANTAALASRVDLEVAPVGPAWRLSLGRHPELPLFADDHVHPSMLGSYLMACVICRTLFEDFPDDLPYRGGVPPNTALYLQRIAKEVVLFGSDGR